MGGIIFRPPKCTLTKGIPPCTVECSEGVQGAARGEAGKAAHLPKRLARSLSLGPGVKGWGDGPAGPTS